MIESSYVKTEIEYPGPIALGDKGLAVKRVQEWLCLHGNQVSIDAEYGPVTARAVEGFSLSLRHVPTARDVVGPEVWAALVTPMTRCLMSIAPAPSLAETVYRLADSHLVSHPREVGGDNRGPWVRLYMGGQEGPSSYWCAGFVSFLLRQAADLLQCDSPLPGSFSCDALARQARDKDLLVSCEELAGGYTPVDRLGHTQIFLVRQSPGDWTHTGFSTRMHLSGGVFDFESIEGNTNDDGSRNGYEVCRRIRGGKGKDFIRLPEA